MNAINKLILNVGSVPRTLRLAAGSRVTPCGAVIRITFASIAFDVWGFVCDLM